MTSVFRPLFTSQLSPSPVEQQRLLVEAFRELLPQSNLMHWKSVGAIPDGSFVLVGVMIGWNAYDQDLAVALDEAVGDNRTRSDTVAIVVADGMTTVGEVQANFPALKGSGQSPYLGVWDNQLLLFTDSGPSASAFLADRYGLNLP